MEHPPVIVQSLKDLNSFIANDKRIHIKDILTKKGMSPRTIYSDYSPRIKLDFDDSTDNDQSSIIDSFNLHNESYHRRHKESIAGFDVTKKIRAKDGELNEAKTTINILESRIDNLQSSNKKRKVDYDFELEKNRKDHFRDKELICDLQHKLKQSQINEKDAKQTAAKLQKNLDDICHQTEKKQNQVKIDSLQVTDKLRQDAMRLLNQLKNCENELAEKGSSVQTLEVVNKQLEDEAKSLHSKLLTHENLNLNCEQLITDLNKEKFKNKELEIRLHDLNKSEKQFDLFENSIRQIPFLEKQIAKLKDDNITHKLMGVNVDLVEEKLSSAECQVRMLNSRCSELTVENETLTLMTEICEKYEGAVKKEFNIDYMPPVSEFVALIQDMKKRDKDATAALHELKQSLKSHSNYRTSNDERLEVLEEDLKTTKQEAEKLTSCLRRLQRKLVLVSKERDSMKGIMNSYESESTINIGALEQEKIAKLESILADYKTELDKYDGTAITDSTYRSNKSDDNSGSKTDGNDSELEKRVSDLSQENEMLQLKLEQQILKGSFDPTKNKVIQFIDNPLEKANQDSRDKYDNLALENSSLKKRIELMKAGDDLNITEKVGAKTDQVTNKQVQELKDKTGSQEIQIQRMMDAFKRKSHEMRDIVYRLTGYRVDLRGDNHYKLINTYSDSAQDFLLFQEDAQGQLQLMETDFSLSLGKFVELYLQRGSSYPAFLSAITLNLFNRQMPGEEEEEEDHIDDEEEEEHIMGEEEEEYNMGDEEEEEEPMEDDDDDSLSREDDDLICLD